MTVQEFIDRLEEIEDKSKKVCINNIWEEWLFLEIGEDDIKETSIGLIITVDMP